MVFNEIRKDCYRGHDYRICQDRDRPERLFVMAGFLTPGLKACYGLDSTTSSASWMEELTKTCIDRLCKMEEFSQTRQEMAPVAKAEEPASPAAPVEPVETSTTIEAAKTVDVVETAGADGPAAKTGLPIQCGKDDVIMTRPVLPGGCATMAAKAM